MNKMFTVFKYELMNAIKSKAFIISTLIFMLSIIGFSLFFRFTAQNSMNSALDPKSYIEDLKKEDRAEEKIGYLISGSKLTDQELKEIFSLYDLEKVKSDEDLKTKVEDKTYPVGLIFQEDNGVELVYDIAPIYPRESEYIIGSLKNYLANQKLDKYGLSLEDVKKIEDEVNVNSKISAIKGNNAATMPFAMLISIILYMLIIMNGQVASMNVAREKNDRTMELLITSTKPSNLINGKVIASFFQSMITVLAVGVATVIAYFINKDLISTLFSNISFSIDPMVIVISILFFIFGYIMYLYIYAALGATVSATEEINSAVAPITIVVVLVYFGTISALSNPDPNNIVLKILSFIPFSSMFTMHARYALTQVPLIEVGISFGILIITTIILSVLSVKLYRSSSLNYGNRNKLFNKIKKIFKK